MEFSKNLAVNNLFSYQMSSHLLKRLTVFSHFLRPKNENILPFQHLRLKSRVIYIADENHTREKEQWKSCAP